MAKGLTDKQQLILEFIQEYVENTGYPPSIREIGSKFNIGSLRGVTVHLDALLRKGYISRTSLPRSIRVVHPDFQRATNTVSLPLLGSIAAGEPIYSEGNVEDMILLPTSMVTDPEHSFVLRVVGESMIGDGIMPHDLVIVKQQSEARQNELVAVRLGDSATVKRVKYDKGNILLMPSNPDFKPIEVKREDATVLGKVVGLIRDYSGKGF